MNMFRDVGFGTPTTVLLPGRIAWNSISAGALDQDFIGLSSDGL